MQTALLLRTHAAHMEKVPAAAFLPILLVKEGGVTLLGVHARELALSLELALVCDLGQLVSHAALLQCLLPLCLGPGLVIGEEVQAHHVREHVPDRHLDEGPY